MTITRSVLLFVLFSAFTTVSFSQETYDILFDTDAHKLTKTESDKLKEVFQEKLVYAMEIKLVGHTDNVGSNTYNLQLSQRRVEKIKHTLMELGFDDQQIRTSYFGESKPTNYNNNAVEKKVNRRVTIQWKLLPPSIKVDEDSIEDLYSLLELDKQSFCIDPNRDTILILEQGTILTIPAHAFTIASTECVTFKAKEVYSKSDMIRENLSTTSNGELLESGGMIYTEAADANGNTLSLANGKTIGILMPTDTVRNDMQLFYGERDQHHNMNWIAGNENFNSASSNDIINWGGGQSSMGVKCPILFCRLFGRMGITIKGMFNKEIRMSNRKFRQKNRGYSRSNRLAFDYPNYNDSLYDAYGVDNWEDLADTLAKINLQNNFEQMYEGTVETGALNKMIYNITTVNKLGWINCDAFSNTPAFQVVTMQIDLNISPKVDCKAVFRSKNSVMSASYYAEKYAFASIPKNKSIWLLALKYEDKKAYIYLEQIKTKQNADPIQFSEISIDDLKIELNKLND